MDNADNNKNKYIRGALNAASGAIPFACGLLSAAAGYWSEKEQEDAMAALRAIIKMLEDEMREKHRTIIEVMTRLDMHDEEIRKRVASDEYQSLIKKALRNWAGTESQKKQEYIRNLLCNAASAKIVDDDVIRLFIEWLQTYSELHFSVISVVYQNPGITRGAIWNKLGKAAVREDSAEADLFKLLIDDLSFGRIIRQHREVDYYGNQIKKQKPPSAGRSSNTLKSAFNNDDPYELTALGQQFVHYAMTEVTIKIEYHPEDPAEQPPTQEDAA